MVKKEKNTKRHPIRRVRAYQTAVGRLRHIAGFPSGLVISFFFTFYLLINFISWYGARYGMRGMLVPVLVSALITGFLIYRWQKSFSVAVSPLVDQSGAGKLPHRRGLIVLVGLDSASPDTSFIRLLDEAEKCEYIALVTTVQDDQLGVTTTLRDKILPASPRHLELSNVRVWSGNNAESLSDIETSVTKAIAWMQRHDLHESEIVVDVTKGRRSMEFGALIAADKAQVEVQYLASAWHHIDNKAIPGTQGFRVVRTLWEKVGPRALPPVETYP